MACSDSLLKRELFKKPGGFRIPALLHIPDSNILLAFAESRLGSNDESADVLYMQRGVYNKSLKDFQWEHATPMNSAKLENCRSMNPCPVYETGKRKTFLFFIAVEGTTSEQEQIKTGKNAAHLCYVTSVDNGQTWRDTVHLTDKCNGPKKESCICKSIDTWATFALGPGHGIQLNSGRLVIPAHAHVKERICKIRVRAFTFYSEDRGDSWQIGEFISGEECGECQVVSLDQGIASSKQSLIYCNARNNKADKNQYRVEAFSTDGGKTFTEGKFVNQLVEYSYGCHGSIISFHASDISNIQNYSELKNYHTQKGGDASNFHIILFSHITKCNPRRDLGMYLCTYSSDLHTQTNPCSGGGLTWTNPWVFFPDESAYSEMAFVKLPEETNPIVTCLFESEHNNVISFRVFQIDDIIEKTVKKINDFENPETGKCAISRCFCSCCC